MTEHILTDYPSYVDAVMRPDRPRFNPYVIRRENRLLLCVPGDDAKPIRTFELDPIELTRMLVGAHEALRGYTLDVQGRV